MLGIFSSLARAPWWLLAAMAAAVALFGGVVPGLDLGGTFGEMPDLLGMLERAAPQIAPAIAWLESMGFQQDRPSFGIQKETWFESRAPAISMALGCAAVLRLFFAAPKFRPQSESESFLNSAKTINAVLKNAPGAIDEEAWNNPLQAASAPLGENDPERQKLRAKPRHAKETPAAQPAAVAQVKARPAKRKRLFHRPSAEEVAERAALQSAFKAKLEGDPFEKLAREARR
ncbi:MAG: hypothetical protein AAF618_05860 [Pseudomonadota bacterium]